MPKPLKERMTPNQQSLFKAAVEANRQEDETFEEMADRLGLDSKKFQRMRNEGPLAPDTSVRLTLGISEEDWEAARGDSLISEVLSNIYPDGHPKEISGATELWFTGLNLRRIIPGHESWIEAVCGKEKGALKVVLLDPDDREACRYGALQEYGDENKLHEYKSTIELALNTLQSYKGLKVGLKVIKYALGFGLDGINASQEDGIIYVRFYPLRKAIKKMPTATQNVEYETCEDQPIWRLVGTNLSTKYWYEFYRKQFYTIWNMAEDWPRTVSKGGGATESLSRTTASGKESVGKSRKKS